MTQKNGVPDDKNDDEGLRYHIHDIYIFGADIHGWTAIVNSTLD